MHEMNQSFSIFWSILYVLMHVMIGVLSSATIIATRMYQRFGYPKYRSWLLVGGSVLVVLGLATGIGNARSWPIDRDALVYMGIVGIIVGFILPFLGQKRKGGKPDLKDKR
jgi:hypothetical protein